MSYEVTATRRRPQTFDDLVGQEFVASTLKNSIKSGKIAHAFLFSGPRGCGKTSTARILAKALNCANGPTDTPCGTCQNCQEITKGSSLDVIEIDGASNTSVENIRQIKDEVLFPPANSRYKIYIIDEVHMLSTSAFNALLKTIEEPPPYVIFIFATTELQMVPATIKSRCQQFNFRLVAIDKVKECLAQAAAELNIQADDEALFWIARESTGSMRDAYTLFDQVVAFSEGHITYEKIRDKLGLVGIDRLNTIFEACATNQTETVINLLDEFLQAGVSIEQTISNSADYLRSLLLIKSGITKESLLGNSVERYSRTVLNAWNPIQIERGLSLLLQLYRDIRYSLSPRYELELAFSRLCWIGQYVSNAEVKKAIDAAQALLCGNSVPAAVATQTQSAPVTPAEPQVTSMPQVPPAPPVTETPAENGTSQSLFSQNFQNAVQSAENELTPQQVAQSALNAAAMNNSSENNNSGYTGNIPPGLPKLSMLADLEKKESEAQNNQGDSSNPFYNGGSLPPNQSVSGYYENDQFSLNPDDENDGWTISDEIPEDNYYPDNSDEIAQSFAQSLEGEENTNQQSQQTPVQNNEHFITGDGSSLTVAQLRGKFLAGLAVTNSFITTAIEKTGLWVINDNSISTTVESEYEMSLINKNIPTINQELSKLCGKNMTFSISVKKNENQQKVEVVLPQQVKLLLDVFKGSLVGR